MNAAVTRDLASLLPEVRRLVDAAGTAILEVYATGHDRFFDDSRVRNGYQAGDLAPVSYTHLTLPTITSGLAAGRRTWIGRSVPFACATNAPRPAPP